MAGGSFTANQAQPGAIIGDPNTSTYLPGGNWALLNPPPALETPAFTVEAWFKVPVGSTGTKSIYRHRIRGLALSLVDGKPLGRAWFGPGDQFNTVTSPTSFADDAWHHLAFTHDASSLKLYVDGGLVADAPAPAGTSFNSYNVSIGWDPDTANAPSSAASTRWPTTPGP